jgi:hypothetical protein
MGMYLNGKKLGQPYQKGKMMNAYNNRKRIWWSLPSPLFPIPAVKNTFFIYDNSTIFRWRTTEWVNSFSMSKQSMSASKMFGYYKVGNVEKYFFVRNTSPIYEWNATQYSWQQSTGVSEEGMVYMGTSKSTGECFAFGFNTGVRRYNGTNWVRTNITTGSFANIFNDLDGTIFLTRTEQYIYRWLNGNFVNTGVYTGSLFYSGFNPKNGQLFIGISNGVKRWDRANSQWLSTNVTVGSIFGSTGKAFFCGTYETTNGIYKWDGASWQATNLTGKQIHAFGKTSTGTLFAGTETYGIYRWDGSQWVETNITSNLCYNFCLFSNGDFFASTSVGTKKWDGSQWVATNITSGYGKFAETNAEKFFHFNASLNGVYLWNGAEFVKTRDWNNYSSADFDSIISNDITQISF